MQTEKVSGKLRIKAIKDTIRAICNAYFDIYPYLLLFMAVPRSTGRRSKMRTVAGCRITNI